MRATCRRTLSLSSRFQSPSPQRRVPELVQAARERLQQQQPSSASAPAGSIRLPRLQPRSDQSEDTAALLPAFRRDQQTSAFARDILSQTAYDASTSELVEPVSKAQAHQAYLEKLPLLVQSGSQKFWRWATEEDVVIRHATLALVRRCLKAKEHYLAHSVIRRKIALDGQQSVSPEIWKALGGGAVAESLLLEWLERIQKLTGHEKMQEMGQWRGLWKRVRSERLHRGQQIQTEVQEVLGKSQDPEHAQRILRATLEEPFKWTPQMAPTLFEWLGRHRHRLLSARDPAGAEDVVRLMHTLQQLYPPPSTAALSHVPPPVEALQSLQRAYETHQIAQARQLLAQLVHTDLPAQFWQVVRTHDPSLIIWSALRYFLTQDLNESERQAWRVLYESVSGPAVPLVRANRQSAIQADRAVRGWLEGVSAQETVVERLALWSREEYGEQVTDMDVPRAIRFLYLCRGRQDLREAVGTLIMRMAEMPMKHKRRWQMQILHTLLAVHAGQEPLHQLVARLESYMSTVWSYDPATSQSPPALDSGVLRPLWTTLEARAPVFDKYPGLLSRALELVDPSHPYLGPDVAKGMPDAAALLTRLASKEIQWWRSMEDAERAEAVERQLKEALKRLELKFEKSGEAEKDGYRVLQSGMGRARKAGIRDWTGFFEIKER